MGMAHFTSGRRGYEDYDGNVVGIAVAEDTVKAMLKRENELRLSVEVQNAYQVAIKNEGFEGFISVTEDLQRRVASEFEFEHEQGLQILRCAHLLISKAEASELSIYRKYNRLRDGWLVVGSPAPQVETIFSLDGAPIEGGLLGLREGEKPLVLISASVT